MRDWKHAPFIYPVAETRLAHDRADRVANWLVGGFVLGAACVWLGHEIGYARRDRIAVVEEAAAPRIASCPKSTPDEDVIEHAWTHQGVVIHRECLVIGKPVYTSPRYAHRSPPTM